MKQLIFLLFSLTAICYYSCSPDSYENTTLESTEGQVSQRSSVSSVSCEPTHSTCGLEWLCESSALAGDECTIDLGSTRIYNMLQERIAQGGCEIASVVIDIIPCDPNAAPIVPNPPQNPQPSFANLFEVQYGSRPFNEFVESITLECGEKYIINTTITTTGCDNYTLECSDILECKAECCEECQYCGPTKELFTEPTMHIKEVKLIRDLKINFCDGTPSIDYGNNIIYVTNDTPCDDVTVKGVLYEKYGIAGPYVTIDDYMEYLNTQLQLAPGCGDATISLTQNSLGFYEISLDYYECCNCAISSVYVKEFGIDFIDDICEAVYCYCGKDSYEYPTNCGEECY